MSHDMVTLRLVLFKAHTAGQFYALRFRIGLFESAAWPGVQYVLG